MHIYVNKDKQKVLKIKHMSKNEKQGYKKIKTH